MLSSRLTFPSTSPLPGAMQNERCFNRKRRASMEVCRYWMEDRCTRRPCPYVHPPKKQWQQQQQKNKAHATTLDCMPVRNKTWHRPIAAVQDDKLAPSLHQTKTTRHRAISAVQDNQSACARATPSPSPKPAADNHVLNKCKTHEEQPALIANLSGHNAAVTSMVLPVSSQMLFSAGEDAMLRAWDCSSGLCSDILHLAHPPSCLFNSFSDPHWLFIGLPDEVRVCNLSTQTQQTLAVNSPVVSLSSLRNLLVAGLQNGVILVWRFEPSSASFHHFKCLSAPSENNGMTASPVSSLEPSLAPGSSIIYAGSLDGMIRTWDLASGCCLQVLCAHKKAVTRLLSCDSTLLLSASQDGAIKLWKVSDATDHQLSLEDTFLPKAAAGHGSEDGGANCPQPLAICGVFDEANTPVLFAAYSDNKVHMMEVPSFKCKGTIRTKSPIQAMDTGSGNMLFLGSSKGDISVWKWK